MISGITHASSGFPVTLSSADDNSLQGSNPNGVNSRYMDLPDVVPGHLNINRNPGMGSLFQYGAVLGKRPGNSGQRLSTIFLWARVVQHRPGVAEIGPALGNKNTSIAD